MHDIYAKLAPIICLEKWGEAKNQKYIEVLNAEADWCKENNINFTPEILVNGRSFPNEYERSDLSYFVDEIIEEEQEKIEVSRLLFKRKGAGTTFFRKE